MKSTCKLPLLLAMLGAIAGCAREPHAPLRIGTNVWPGYAPIYLAQGLNYFDADLVRPVAFPATTETIAAFRGKAIDAAALTLDEALTLAQFDAEFAVVLVADISHGADAIVGRTGLTSLTELRGRRIGLETTAVCAYTLARALQKAGLRQEEVTLINVNVNEQESAFGRGAVDAVVTFEPVRTRLLASGARLLFDSSQIPNEILDVVVVRTDYLRAHPDVVAGFVGGWFRALAYLKEHPDAAAEKMKGYLKLSAAEVLQSLKGLRLPDRDEVGGLLSGDAPRLLETARTLQRLMLEQRLLIKKTDVSPLFDRESAKTLYGR